MIFTPSDRSNPEARFQMLGRRDNRHERPYRIDYVRVLDGRVLGDSARTLDDARVRIEARLSKRHNKGEIGRIYLRGKMIREIMLNNAGGFTTSVDIADL